MAIFSVGAHIGMLAGFTQALGMLGAASGEYPVAFLVERFGWRASLWGMAAGFTILSVLMAYYVRDRVTIGDKTPLDERRHKIFESLKNVLSNPQTWWNATFSGLLFVPTAVLGESWGVEYLKSAHGLSHHQAAFANSMIFIGWGVGGPVIGALSDRVGRRKIIMMLSTVMSFVMISILVWGPVLTNTQIIMLMLVYGFFNTGVGVSYALATEINPRRDNGVSIAFANMGSIIIGALLLPLVGKLIDWHSQLAMTGPHYTGADFQYAMNILPISLVLAFVFVLFVKETYCKPIEE